MKHSCIVLLLTGLLSACAPSAGGLAPGKSALPQVLAQMGDPSMVWSEANGVLLMEFAHVPPGYENFMARIGSDGVLISLQQVLTEANAKTLKEGMSHDQVRQILGRPARIEDTAASGGGERWHWPLDAARPPGWQLDVQFGATGTVMDVQRSRMPSNAHS